MLLVARARARDGRGRGRLARSDGRHHRARGRSGGGALRRDRGRLAGELQLPGPAGRERHRGRRDRLHAPPPRLPGPARARAPQGVGRLPQPADRARRRPPAARRSRRSASAEPAHAVPLDHHLRRRAGQQIASILVRQLTSPVRFTQAVGALRDLGVRTFVEVGPGSVLAGPRQADRPQPAAVSVGSPDGLASARTSTSPRA